MPASTAYNYTAMTYLNWFTPCYVGWRGGLRSKYVPVAYSNPGMLMVRRIGPAVDQADCDDYDYNLEGETASAKKESYLQMHEGCAGTEVSLPFVDGSVEVEFPLYVNKRFVPARAFLDGSAGSDELNERGENFGHIGYYDSNTTEGHVHRYVAAGDDFSLFMWIGSPPILRRTRPVSATLLQIQGGY